MWTLYIISLLYTGWLTRQSSSSLLKESVEIDLQNGVVKGYSPYITFLTVPRTSYSRRRCDAQAVIKIDFSGPYTGAKFQLEYSDKPRLWSLDISDSPGANGYGGDNGTTSNMAEAQIFNRQFRVYGNNLPGYLDASVNGDLLLHVEDDIIKKRQKITVDVSDEKIEWASGDKKDYIESKFLYTLSGQEPLFGKVDYDMYAGFNRVVAGNYRYGTGLCKATVTLYQGDINECATGHHTCHKNAICINTRRSFRCKCKDGFYGNGQICVDVNECEYENGGCVHSCFNTMGNFSCSCKHGFQLANDGFNCLDVDECQRNRGGCQHSCINTFGGHECTCPSGYTLHANGKRCLQSTWCHKVLGCSHNCHSSEHGWTCFCQTDYKLHPNGKGCIATCAVGNGGCQHICTDTDFGPQCSCAPKYKLGNDRKTCLATCEVNNGGCDRKCEDSTAGPICLCPDGYLLHQDGKTCVDINECIETEESNGGCSHECVNTIGSYQCLCPKGFKAQMDEKICKDINECYLNTTCDQICVNTPGSYICQCKKGYEQYGVTHCGDVNECSMNSGGCQHKCMNTDGSYECRCRPGYRLLSNKKDCVLFDKCYALKPPAKAQLSCSQAGGEQQCVISCLNKARFTSQPPTSYTLTCGAKTGFRWTHDEQNETLPSCSEVIHAPSYNKRAAFVFTARNCRLKAKSRESFKDSLKKILTEKTKFRCTDQLCQINYVDLYCGTKRRKFRRLARHDKQVITAEFELEVLPRSPTERCDVECVRKKAERLMKKTIRTLRKKINREQLFVRVDEEDYPVSRRSFKTSSDIIRKCGIGQVLVDHTCVACSIGTYFNGETNQCEPCAKGTYQDREGQSSCQNCPGPEGTGIVGARNLTECGGQCQPGYYSTEGFIPCNMCPYGQYQPEYGRTHCISCGLGISTRRMAARSFQECTLRESCHPGHYYNKKSHSCVACPRGTYQPSGGLDYCIDCPGETVTDDEGAINSSYCKGIKCGGEIGDLKGFIQSPNYPGEYPNNVECIWTIQPQKGRRILVVIPDIFLESQDQCGDQLVMRKSTSRYSVTTYETCESTERPIAFTARSKKLWIRFKSDGKNSARGFSIPYVTYDEEYQDLIEDIVKDGRLYSSQQHQEILKDRHLLSALLDVIATPYNYFKYANVSRSMFPSSFIRLLTPKVRRFFS